MQIEDSFGTEAGTYAKTKMANGLRVIVCSRPLTRSFGWCLKVRAGGRDGKPHIAHLVEHLAYSKRSKLDSLSARANAFTYIDRTEFHAEGHVENIDATLDTIRNVLRPLSVNPQRVKQELEVLRREQIEFGWMQLLLNSVHYRVVGGNALGCAYKVNRHKPSFPKFTADECNQFHQDFYRPDNSELAIVSPLPIDRVLRLLQVDAGERIHAPAPSNSEHKKMPNRLIWQWFYNYYATCCVWHKQPVSDMSQWLKFNLANKVLGGQGRLFDALRIKNQLAYGIYVDAVKQAEQICHIVSVNPRTAAVKRAIELIASEFKRFQSPIPRDEFDEQLRNCCQSFELLEEDSFQLPKWLLQWNENAENLVTPQHLSLQTKKITRELLAEFAVDFFRTENRNIYLAGSFGPLGWHRAKRFAVGKL